MEKSKKLDELIDSAEELLTNLADAHDPQIQTLRDRVDHAINDAWRSIAQQSDTAAQVRDFGHRVDGYVREYPWLAVATGVLIAGAVGFIAGAMGGTRRRR